MLNSQRPGTGALRLAVLTGLAIVCALLAHAAQPLSFKATNVKYPDYYDPPNQSKLRALVRGSEAVPEGKNRVRVKDVHIESFHLNGKPEAIVDAPDCVYDHETRAASSDGPVKAQTADGRMRIEGTGFSLSVTNKSLTISNNVRTVIRDLGLNPKKP